MKLDSSGFVKIGLNQTGVLPMNRNYVTTSENCTNLLRKMLGELHKQTLKERRGTICSIIHVLLRETDKDLTILDTVKAQLNGDECPACGEVHEDHGGEDKGLKALKDLLAEVIALEQKLTRNKK
jgi:DNA repair exonuclease SbcCD ATPase subunit